MVCAGDDGGCPGRCPQGFPHLPDGGAGRGGDQLTMFPSPAGCSRDGTPSASLQRAAGPCLAQHGWLDNLISIYTTAWEVRHAARWRVLHWWWQATWRCPQDPCPLAGLHDS